MESSHRTVLLISQGPESETLRTFTFRDRHRLQARLPNAALGCASAVKLLLDEGLSLTPVALGVDINVSLELPADWLASEGLRRLNKVQTAHLSALGRSPVEM